MFLAIYMHVQNFIKKKLLGAPMCAYANCTHLHPPRKKSCMNPVHGDWYIVAKSGSSCYTLVSKQDKYFLVRWTNIGYS